MWDKGPSRFNVVAWLLWLLAAMLGALLTRNPFYLVVVIAAAMLVSAWLNSPQKTGEEGQQGSAGSIARGRGLLLRMVVIISVVVALFKGLSIHLGLTVLFRLPEEWPVVGGPITLEGLASAGLDALSLLAVLTVFTAFSAGADYYALLRSVPAFMHQIGLVTSIAITFVPQTVARFTEIQEAQALRGHRVRRVGDLVPLIVPLLAGGMERSINLAEAMESRGFSRITAGARRLPPVAVQAGLVIGLGFVLAGATSLAFLASAPWVGWSTIAAGLAIMGYTLWAVGAGMKRSRYRRTVWRDGDTALVLVSLGIAAMLLTYRLLAPFGLIYDPLLRLRIYPPPLDPVLAAALAALAAPPLIARIWRRHAS